MFTVSLVTYKNSPVMLEGVLNSVKASLPERFFIVDHSPDDSLRCFESVPERISYIRHENTGYGAGHNVALRKALEMGNDYHVIANPDITFEPGTVERIIAFMEANPKVGLVMPKTVSPDGTMLFNCKLLPSPLDLIFKRFLPGFLTRKRMDRFMMKWGDYEKAMNVPYLCGCFMVFRMAALRDAGLFDERFFMYPEDIDITRRIYSSGWRTVYYPEAEVVHAHEAASYKDVKMLFIHIVNMTRYFNKWGWLLDSGRRRINREIIRNPFFRSDKADELR